MWVLGAIRTGDAFWAIATPIDDFTLHIIIYTVEKNCHYDTVVRYWSCMDADERTGHGDCISTCIVMAKMVGVRSWLQG